MKLKRHLHQKTFYPTIPYTEMYEQSGYEDSGAVDSDYITKVNTPDYRKVVASGELLPVNPYSRDKVEGDCYLYLLGKGKQWKKAWNFQTVETDCKRPIVTSLKTVAAIKALNPLVKDAVRQRAKSKLNSNVANVVVDLPTELGELSETVKLVKDYVDAAVNYAVNFKKLNQKWSRNITKLLQNARDGQLSYRHIIKNIALEANNKKLEFDFGWKPLYGLCESSADLLRRQMNGEPTKLRVYGSNFEIIPTSTTFADSFFGNSTLPTYTYTVHEQWKFSVSVGGVLLDEERWKRLDLKQQLGLDPSNLIPALWELTTLSFIADYFVNIEGLLSNLKWGAQKMKSESLFISEKIEHKTWIEFEGFTPRADTASYRFTNQTVGTIGKPQVRTVVCFSRQPTTATGLLVTPAIRVPTWDHVSKTLSVALAIVTGGRDQIHIRR